MEHTSHNLLSLGSTINDLDDRLPKSRGDCFDVGIWGGCGYNCPIFLRGDCEESQELVGDEVYEEFCQDDLNELADYYESFEKYRE